MEPITISLSLRDSNVLSKIKDPEWNPSAAVIIDATLPSDPNITDPLVYSRLVQKEREIVQALQQLETQLIRSRTASIAKISEEYRSCMAGFADLIDEHPDYASARNNRVQGLRRLYGRSLFLSGGPGPGALLSDEYINLKEEADRKFASAHIVLSDLDEAIKLQTPKTPHTPISSQAGKTLSSAHTQRGAIYHMIAKFFEARQMESLAGRKESSWTKIDFEEAASRDFALGARYGNEIAKGLAVGTNPTAKLCGQMVAAAMKEEYGPYYGNMS